jgi:hypothetical protein
MKSVIPLCLAAIVLSPAASAHHSFAVHFVGDSTVAVSGVVKEFRFTNPHGVLFFTAVDENGVEQEWKAETNSPNVLRRRGWDKDVLKPGDKITVDGFPSRDESNYMRISHVLFDDGRELTAQARAD